ncbi:Hpt domain-containing protein [Rhodoferax sp.]|uniref:Hpt domain-containing protein n=1 Tax=Rhodoferax sp. TaxID=50421 RepID=UPI00374C95AE
MTSLREDAQPVYLDLDLAISQIGDAAALPGMLGMLEESLARDIPKISEVLAAGDVLAANRLLHPLKGFLPIFCGDALCANVSRVEALSKAGACAVVAPAYAALRPELELLLAEVTHFLNASGAAH